MTNQATVLLTGFEPFAGDQINPSAELVTALAKSWSFEANLVTEILPVEFETAATRLSELVKAHNPDFVLNFGLAGGRSRVSLERVAINLADARIADNAGVQPSEQENVDSGNAAYFTKLPIKELYTSLSAKELPIEISNTAGTFVCNQIFYRLMHQLEQNNLDTKAGFIHVPAVPEMLPTESEQPSLPLNKLIETVEALIGELLTKHYNVKENQASLES